MVDTRDRTIRLTALAVWAVLAWSGAACAAATNTGASGEDFSCWPLVATVRLDTVPAKGLVEFELTPKAISKARESLGDLRLTDGAGQIVPYVTRSGLPKPPTTVSVVSANLHNAVCSPGQSNSVTADFGDGPSSKPQVQILTPGNDFCRRVTVEGSADGNSWQVLRESDWIFSVSHENGTYVKNTVAMPENDFRYLRVTVFHAPGDPSDLHIEAVTSSATRVEPPDSAKVDIAPGAVSVAEKPKRRATEIEVDLGFEKLPLCEVELAFEDERFMRRVEVLGRDSKTLTITQVVENAPPRKRQIDAPWRSLGGGVIHRFDGLTASRFDGLTASRSDSAGGPEPSANLSVPLNGGCRYLKIVIYNGDDAPLKFVKAGLAVRRLHQCVAFQAKVAGPYKLYVGNDKAPAPRYDLSHYADRLRAEGVTKAAMDSVAANPLFSPSEKELAWSERHKGLIWGAMIFLGLVLAIMLGRQLKKAPPSVREG